MSDCGWGVNNDGSLVDCSSTDITPATASVKNPAGVTTQITSGRYTGQWGCQKTQIIPASLACDAPTVKGGQLNLTAGQYKAGSTALPNWFWGRCGVENDPAFNSFVQNCAVKVQAAYASLVVNRSLDTPAAMAQAYKIYGLGGSTFQTRLGRAMLDAALVEAVTQTRKSLRPFKMSAIALNRFSKYVDVYSNVTKTTPLMNLYARKRFYPLSNCVLTGLCKKSNAPQYCTAA